MRTDGGIIRDVIEDYLERGKSVYARNRVISEKFQASSNEPGFESIAEYPGMVATGIIGTDKDYAYYFLINESAPQLKEAPTDCKIVKLGKHVNEIIIDDPALAFPFNRPITGIHDYNYKGEEIIGFSAENYPPSLLNTDKLPFALNADKSLIDQNDIDLLKIFPNIGTCNLHLREISDTGGALETGAYIFFLSYLVEENFNSNFVQYSRPVYIYKSSHSDEFIRIDGNEGGIPTTKSIDLGITDLDTRYSRFTLAALKIQNGIQTAVRVGDFNYSGSSAKVTISDLSNREEMALGALLIDFPEFKTARTMEVSNDRIHLGNLTREPRHLEDGQGIANGITVEWVWEDMVSLSKWSGSYKDEVMIYDKQGFMADEVYALYIGFKFKDGTRSKAYHIPGRAAQTVSLGGQDYNENDLFSDILDNDPTLTQFTEDAKISNKVRYFHTRETAKSDGTMGYWENQNEFYENGEKVRHHKFPSLASLEQWRDDPEDLPADLEDYTPGYIGNHPQEAFTYDEGDPASGNYGQRVETSGNQVSRVLGLKLSNISIPLSVREKINSFEIFYAKRSLRNATILGQGYATAVDQSASAGADDRWENIAENEDRILFYCFDMLSDRVNVGVSFLKNYFTESTLNDPLYTNPPSVLPPAVSADGVDPDGSDFILHIEETTFIPGGGEVENHATGPGNMHGPFYDLKPSSDLTVFTDSHVAAVAFKPDVYRDYQNQELVSVCKAFKVSAQESEYETGKLYRGDTYTCYFAPYASVTRWDGGSESGGNISCSGPPDVRGVVVQSQKNVYLRLSSDTEEEWYLKYFPKYQKPFLLYYPTFADMVDPGNNDAADVTYRLSALCWDDYQAASADQATWDLNRQAAAAFLNDSYAFNEDFSVVFADKAPLIHHYQDPREVELFPNLIARSTKKVEGELFSTIRKFLVNEFYELRRDRGEIIALVDVNGELFIQCRNSLFKTVSQDTLPTDLNEIYLGSADIFRTEPRELITDEKGYAGGQSLKSVIKCKHGLISVDSYTGKIFLAGNSFSEISNRGMRNWFRENLKFWFQENFPDLDLHYDNAWAPNGLGTTCVFDERFNRLIVTKKDFKPRNPQSFTLLSFEEIEDLSGSGIFYFAQDGLLYRYNDGEIQKVTLGTDKAFENLSWTWSFSFDKSEGEWISEHDYLITMGSRDRNDIFSWNGNKAFIHRGGAPGVYYDGIPKPFILDLVLSGVPEKTKQLAGLSWVTRVFDGKKVKNNETIDAVAVYNDRQCSGKILLTPQVNVDAVSQSWNFRQFRDLAASEFERILLDDYSINDANIDPNKPVKDRRRFYGKYNVVRFIDYNTRGYVIYLQSLESTERILK